MIVVLIFFAIILIFTLNFTIGRKILNKNKKKFLFALNIIVLAVFILIMIFTVFIENKFNFFIDQQIISLEKQVNTIYPDILNKQIDTKEIKKILESTFENSQTENIDAIVTNIFKATIKNYTSLAVETINKLEKKENKLSIKEALVSLKEISYGKIIQYIKVIRILLTALLVVYCIISLIYSIYNSKQRVGKNKSIIFGEESEDTALGMNVEN